ncbi:MAG: methylated-DNA--[protein]-cysteine S-methyltransferase [Culturomica sp.]|jgi:methylated-DNA-[protein]-cysteine S-methyltransferase|nr:methylated-DNA--[protein]-cysteine S-methyltransferase [Culturomica sp.]
MEKTPVIVCKPYHSPCGELLLGSFEDKLCLCNWQTKKRRDQVDQRLQRLLSARYKEGTSDVIEQTTAQLDEYFARRRREFDIPLLFAGTPFQKAVWQALLTVPYGTTLSYAALAKQLGTPKAVRAVANANGANAISIFVPCHRIIGSDRSLTGYGGGLPAKTRLLELESGVQYLETV